MLRVQIRFTIQMLETTKVYARRRSMMNPKIQLIVATFEREGSAAKQNKTK